MIAQHAPVGAAAQKKQQAIAGQYIVTYRAGRTPAAAAPSKLGLRNVRTYNKAVRGYAAKLTAAQLATVKADPAVASVVPDKVVSAYAPQTPTPSWGLDRIDQGLLPLNNSYTAQGDGSGVTVYVLDSGLRSSHTEFTGRVGTGINFVGAPAGGDTATGDCQGHGTHVAGTIGGSTYGVAKGVTIVPVRVLDCDGAGVLSEVISGIEWVTANHVANSVANMSLGGKDLPSIDNAVAGSIATGIPYVLSAGNGDFDDNGNWVGPQDACKYSPARTPAAITVGATGQPDENGNLVSGSWDQAAYYSNYGSCVDLYAPGSAIRSAGISSDTSNALMSGTSMASPHVAGLVAQILQAHPGATPEQVRGYLTTYASHGVITGLQAGTANLLAHTEVDAEAPVIRSIARAIRGQNVAAGVAAVDPGSGIAGYSYTWDHAATSSTVDTTIDTTGATIGATLAQGIWYLHVRVVDKLGNWSGTANSAAYVVDVTAPKLTGLRVKPAAKNRFTVYVSGNDNVSGVGAFIIVWNHSATSVSGTATTTPSTAVVSPLLANGTWYVHVRVRDKAGNLSGWTHSGAYKTPQKFVTYTVTQGASCSSSVRGYFGYTKTKVLERCSTSSTSTALRWRPF